MAFVLISLLTSTLLFSNWQRGDLDLRIGFLKSAIVHGVLITICTELLSLSNRVTGQTITLFWVLIALIHGVSFLSKFTLVSDELWLALDDSQQNFQAEKRLDRVISIVITVLLFICLLTALITPPDNYDSMTYHMARVMHWIQNGTIHHYPTHILRQLYSFPGSSYLILNLQLLVGSDRFANGVQWLALLGSILATSLIAKEVFGRSFQWLTALVCMSIPMAIMQSTTTQNDLLTGFWLACFAYFALKKGIGITDLAWSCAALGLCILTKPTGAIFALPLILICTYRYFYEATNDASHSQPLTKQQIGILAVTTGLGSGLITLIALSFSLPHFLRNYQIFSSFLEPATLDPIMKVVNTAFSIPLLISNILRHLALSVPIPQFWFLVDRIHQIILHVDSSDPRITFGGQQFLPHAAIASEFLIPDADAVCNPIHMILLIFAYTTFITQVLRQKSQPIPSIVTFFFITPIFGFVVYCSLISWQVWSNRLLLPGFILASPIIGYWISQFLSKAMRKSLILILSLTALVYSLTPIYHPLVPLPLPIANQSPSILFLSRNQIYFHDRYQVLMSNYQLLSEYLQQDQCQTLGLIATENTPEYLLWRGLEIGGIKTVTIKHIKVENQSKTLPEEVPNTPVCAILDQSSPNLRYIRLQSNGTQS
jgi:hypothetical protein